jgi:hypothetical protein
LKIEDLCPTDGGVVPIYCPPRWNKDSKGIPLGRQITQITTALYYKP